MKPVQEIKNRTLRTFCLNNEVYRVNSQSGPGRINTVSQTDQICVCTKQNQLFFYEAYIPPAGMTQFREETRQPMAAGYPLGVTPTQIIWDGDSIYVASKKCYMIYDYQDGQPVAKYDLVQTDIPMMAVCKDKCLVVTRLGKEAQFLLPQESDNL